MAHRIKALFIAMAAMAALGAVAASGAQAEPLFHSASAQTTLTIREDGTGKTGHQVFDAGGNGGITCKKISGQATTTTNTTTIVTVKNIAYSECSFLGTEVGVFVNMNGCEYEFTSHGGQIVNSMETGLVHVKCPAGKEIEFGIPTCTVKVPAQTPTGAGGGAPAGGNITFHNIATAEVTVEANVAGIHYSSSGLGCIVVGSGTNGEYTTGNAIVTGEEDGTTNHTAIRWE